MCARKSIPLWTLASLPLNIAARAKAVGRRRRYRSTKIPVPKRLIRARRKYFCLQLHFRLNLLQLLWIRLHKFGRHGQRTGAVVRRMNLNGPAQVLRTVLELHLNAQGRITNLSLHIHPGKCIPPAVPAKEINLVPEPMPSRVAFSGASTRINSGDPASTIAGVRVTKVGCVCALAPNPPAAHKTNSCASQC